MVRAVEASLRRLGTDYLDLYWVHWPDFVTPIDEIIETVELLVNSGKTLHAGLSNFPAWRSAYAAALAAERGQSANLIGVQTEYSLVERSADREILPMAEALGLGAVLYSPLGGGLLTGKYRRSDQAGLPRSAQPSSVKTARRNPRWSTQYSRSLPRWVAAQHKSPWRGSSNTPGACRRR
jgi:aryl-alcohol dehydrogenase-like predicted oxidoreductase